jgi:hypothetical protein
LAKATEVQGYAISIALSKNRANGRKRRIGRVGNDSEEWAKVAMMVNGGGRRKISRGSLRPVGNIGEII